MAIKEAFENDYFKRTGSKVEFVKVENGRVFFIYQNMLFSGKCTTKGRLTTFASQKIERSHV
jgi:hypothetical protein